jgi:hypothetical protein
MFFVKIALLSAILTKNISNVNDNITVESLSINDLLESIEFLTKSIIARKQKKIKGVCRFANRQRLTRVWAGGGEKRILGASQGRRLASRGGVAGFFRRKIPVTMTNMYNLPSKKIFPPKIFGF